MRGMEPGKQRIMENRNEFAATIPLFPRGGIRTWNVRRGAAGSPRIHHRNPFEDPQLRTVPPYAHLDVKRSDNQARPVVSKACRL